MAFATEVDPLAMMPNSFNDSNDVPLSLILDSAIQRTYHQLVLMSDMFPSKSEEDKKVELIEFACKTWQLFLRIFALVKFKRKGHINVSNIMSFLNQQKFIFVNTANYLYDFSKIQLVNARLPNFSIPTAVDVLSTGTYPRLPTCIKERILPPEPISDEDKINTLTNLNRIIQCRLALSELPTQFHNFFIEKGHVKFCVKNEFEIMLTVVSDDYKKPWRLLNIKILVKNPQDPNRTLVHPQQVYYMHELLQRRLYESEKPLLDLFRSLHFFCQSLKLEILFQQMTILNEITSGRFYKICEYVNSKQITIKYWLEYSKNEYDFRFTIMTGEYTDYLQTSHYPPLNWNDHKEIDQILKSNEILIERLVHQVVKIRSKRRLMDLKTKFTSSIPYCSSSIDDEKPALVVKFMNSKFENETLLIMIDYYSGLFYINIPFTPSNFNLTTQIEICLNSDITKLESNISKLRTWFMLKRCEISLRHLSYKCTYDLPIVLFGDDEIGNYFNKIEKNRLFFQLKKTEKTFIMITCKTKEDLNSNKDEINWQDNAEFIDNKNTIRLNYYILKLLKCKYEGDIDQSMRYLKLVSISHLKRNSIMNFLNFSINNLSSDCGGDDSSDTTVNSYEIDNNGCIYEVIKLVSSIEERLPLLNFITILSKQNVITQSIQIDNKLTNSFVNLLNIPKLDSKEMKTTSEILWKKVLKCRLRKIDHKILNAHYAPANSQRPFYNKYNYSIEFLFRERIFDSQEQQNEKSTIIDSFVLYLDLKNVDDIYETFKTEWLSMCQMYRLLKQIYKAFEQYPELKKQIKVLNFNFKQLVISYGHNFSYKMIFQWSKETKQFDIYPIANNSNQYSSNSVVYTHDAPSINYQFMFINEIRRLFNSKHLNIVNLIQILNETCLPSYSLAKLYNLPKFYAYQQTVVPLAGFMLLIVSLTHFKLTYYSRYCLEIHIHNNGLVSIRDGSFGLTDMSMAIEDLHPIQLLSAFLHKFWDDNVEELLKRRSSMVEDDNPMSPIQNNNNNLASFQNSSGQHHYQQPLQQQPQQAQYSNLQHIFLPPTSPAVRPSSAIPPSPIHNYIPQSPGGQQNLIPSSIAPSPVNSFPNFVGSPAVVGSHNSPMTLAPSPGSFMSPASTQQPLYSVQSPVGSYDFTQSPMPIKSPFINMGPSPNPSNMNSGMPIKDSLEEMTKSSNRAPIISHYKKVYSASIPIYLSHSGFMKMLSMNPETGYTPLETFLASNHLKKALLKYIQNDTFRQITELNTSLISFATKLLKIQIVNEITQNFAAFSLNISPLIDQLQTDILQEYFYAKILCPPYRTTAALAYFVLLNTSEVKTLKEFTELLNNELNSRNPWKIKFSWQIPYSYRLKNASNNLSSHYSMYGPGFTRKENKYHFLVNLVHTPMQRIPGPVQQTIMPFLISYDPMQAFITHEYIKLNHEPIGPNENRVIGLVNHWIENAKLRPIDSPLVFSFTQVLSVLNQVQPPPTPVQMPHQMHQM